MRFVIISNDTERCRTILNEFTQEFNKEYKKRLGSWKMKMIKKFIPLLQMELLEDKEKNEFTLFLPIKMPEFKKFREVIKKITGKYPTPKWKERLVDNLKRCLEKNGVTYESVVCMGD